MRESILCLHSSASSGRQWDGFAAPLSARFDVLAPDLLGYGSGASWPAGTPVSLDDEVRALEPVLRAHPAGLHVVGHSYGGAVALELALRWPSRVRSLTLYEPVRFALLLGETPTSEGHEIVQVGRLIGLTALSGRHHAAAAMFVDYWSGPGAWDALGPRRQDAIAARMTKVQAEFEALFADSVPLAAYAQLEMPVCLLRGARSPLAARMVASRLVCRLPHAHLVTLPELGHMAPVTDAAQVVLALPAWLRPQEVCVLDEA